VIKIIFVMMLMFSMFFMDWRISSSFSMMVLMKHLIIHRNNTDMIILRFEIQKRIYFIFCYYHIQMVVLVLVLVSLCH